VKTRICPRYEGSVIDSGYPTREVVKTASPEMLLFAPNGFPSKTGPSYYDQIIISCTSFTATKAGKKKAGLTRMVKVALAGRLALGRVGVRYFMGGMSRPLPPRGKAWLVLNRTWRTCLIGWPETTPIRAPAGLAVCKANRVNMFSLEA